MCWGDTELVESRERVGYHAKRAFNCPDHLTMSWATARIGLCSERREVSAQPRLGRQAHQGLPWLWWGSEKRCTGCHLDVELVLIHVTWIWDNGKGG